VGIISHVAELTEWIPARIEVTKDKNGSHARLVHVEKSTREYAAAGS